MMRDELLAEIERELLGWPGIWKKRDEDGPGGIGVTGYRFGGRRIGHVHDDGVADITFPKEMHDELISTGKAKPHRGGFPSVVSYQLRAPEDVPGALDLFRLSYDRAKESARRRARSGAEEAAM
ncbi:MAG: DUF5519 family protein [Actinomycetota bacterium]|nr:DUF5519 family protein [Actinomycetota bacterium]